MYSSGMHAPLASDRAARRRAVEAIAGSHDSGVFGVLPLSARDNHQEP
jgi:hypothetical protein